VATPINLTTISQFRPHEAIMRARIRIKAAMGTPAIEKRFLLPKALRNRIKFSDSWPVMVAAEAYFFAERWGFSVGGAGCFAANSSGVRHIPQFHVVRNTHRRRIRRLGKW
jgi:hypothetical protein